MPNKEDFNSNEEYLEYYREYREKNRKKIREYNKEYNKIWRKNNGYHNEYKWIKNNKTKVNAEKILEYAITKGKIERKPCAICGEKKTHAHHPNYSKPLEVIFLCPVHHKEIHKAQSKKYLKAIATTSKIVVCSLIPVVAKWKHARLKKRFINK